MTSADALIADINMRVEHIHAQVGLGAVREDVVDEQSKALLGTFSKLSGIELEVVTAVSNHLSSRSGVESHTTHII